MNKNAIKKFAIDARNKLIASVTDKAGMLGITRDNCSEAVAKEADFEVYKTTAGTEVTLGRKQYEQRKKLVEQIDSRGFEAVIEEVAYTWFNRISAIRFMEVNDYMYPVRVRVLSSEKEGKSEPDIVTMAPDIDWDLTDKEREYIIEAKMNNKLDDLFKMLFIKQCNLLHEVLPGLFEETEDYTEMLLNISFTNEDDVVRMLIDRVDEKDFNVNTLDENGNSTGQVEIIGWLYQYYNTELKDDTFAKLKKNVKISKERIPAATQLFTPEWIVRYMVENSVGRIWIEHLRAIDSSVDEKAAAEKFGWKYYLPEAVQEESVNIKLAEIRTTYKDLKPEDITCIDPCMGSGHILIAMFDVLMDIYESVGYDKREATYEIVTHNIHGLDIDKRAYQLAYFAVMMKGRGYNRRFLQSQNDKKIVPKVYAIKESGCTDKNGISKYEFDKDVLEYFINDDSSLKSDITLIVNGMFDAREYGSILKNIPVNYERIFNRFEEIEEDISLYKKPAMEKLYPVVYIAYMLAEKYDVVITNPPYMGASGMGAKLSEYVKDNYPGSKSDLFAVFIEKCGEMTKNNAYQAMITQHAWMFLSSYEKLRAKMMQKDMINMAHLGARAFEEIGGEVVQTTSFVIRKSNVEEYQGIYCRLIEATTQQGKENLFLNGKKQYKAKQRRFGKIPGNPVAYWASEQIVQDFQIGDRLGDIAKPRQGMATTNNNRFLRLWHEVEYENIGFGLKCIEETVGMIKWFPYNKGGDFRKWYGNNDYIVNFRNMGQEVCDYIDATSAVNSKGRIINRDQYFHECISWSLVSSGNIAFRYKPNGFIFDVAGMSCFSSHEKLIYLLGLNNTKIVNALMETLAPTINYQAGDIANIPVIQKEVIKNEIIDIVEENIRMATQDWDSFEVSWDFIRHPLLPCEEEEGIAVFAGLKIGEEKWIKKLRHGSACFSPVVDCIKQGEKTGNNEQGDKYEGVFARLRKDNSLITEIKNKLGKDLEIISDGEYRLLRRISCKTIPIFCVYGFYKEDIEEIDDLYSEDGKVICNFQMTPSSKMYDEFLNSDLLENKKDTWTLAFSLGHMQKNIEDVLSKKEVKYKAVKVKYDLFDSDEFFIEPTEDYPELGHKAKRLSYQKEIRWILQETHQTDKFIVPYSPLEEESIGCHEGRTKFSFNVEGHISQKVSLASCFMRWQEESDRRFGQLKENEEELNRIFIDIYGLQEELTPEVEDKDITVRKADLGRDIRSFLSYAVGCMFGRYSIYKDGLCYAGGGWNREDFKYYASQYYDSGEYPKDLYKSSWFMPDEDNIIPITDEEYFQDDIVSRFVEFVKTVYGAETLEENLQFIADALGNKGDSAREVIRNYFLKDFYADHLRIYQKRPIYWMFDSGKENGFKALIYMHRYEADTVSRVRTDYLHRAQNYVETAMQSAQYTIENSSSASEKSKATKAVSKYTKQIAEMRIYDEAIAHIANRRIEIDLDDGVKVNYEKFQGVEVAQEGKKALKVDLLAKI